MKYIITEDQFKTAEQSIRAYRLEQTIYNFFDGHLTPFDGWDSPQGYARELKENGGELFIRTKDSDEWDLNSSNHMWYSICDNDNLSEPLPEGHCPVVVIPKLTYDALNGYFGDMWKILFKRWFITHTGMNVVQIDGEI
jgi:hypothetical protein